MGILCCVSWRRMVSSAPCYSSWLLLLGIAKARWTFLQGCLEFAVISGLMDSLGRGQSPGKAARGFAECCAEQLRGQVSGQGSVGMLRAGGNPAPCGAPPRRGTPCSVQVAASAFQPLERSSLFPFSSPCLTSAPSILSSN